MARNWGLVSTVELRGWRVAHGHAPTICEASRPAPRLSDSELVARVNELLGDVDLLMRSDTHAELLAALRADLDRLAADLEAL